MGSISMTAFLPVEFVFGDDLRANTGIAWSCFASGVNKMLFVADESCVDNNGGVAVIALDDATGGDIDCCSDTAAAAATFESLLFVRIKFSPFLNKSSNTKSVRGALAHRR